MMDGVCSSVCRMPRPTTRTETQDVRCQMTPTVVAVIHCVEIQIIIEPNLSE